MLLNYEGFKNVSNTCAMLTMSVSEQGVIGIALTRV